MSDRAEIIETMARAALNSLALNKHAAAQLSEDILAALQASGRAVVPVEPTPAMKDAHRRAYHDLGEIATNQWAAMLAAALPPKE